MHNIFFLKFSFICQKAYKMLSVFSISVNNSHNHTWWPSRYRNIDKQNISNSFSWFYWPLVWILKKGYNVHWAATYISSISNLFCRRLIQASGNRSGHVNKVKIGGSSSLYQKEKKNFPWPYQCTRKHDYIHWCFIKKYFSRIIDFISVLVIYFTL